MPRFPNFADVDLFPSFTSCPLDDAEIENDLPTTYLLATISQNMTLSTSPTYIVIDRTNTSFALTVKQEKPTEYNPANGPPEVPGFKKGYTVVVKNAKRRGVKEGKSGFVEVKEGDVEVIPCKLDKLLEMYVRELGESGKEKCQSCRAEEGLNRCKGCSLVWYCGKACQTKGWNERGHKSDCKVFKAMRLAFLESKEISS